MCNLIFKAFISVCEIRSCFVDQADLKLRVTSLSSPASASLEAATTGTCHHASGMTYFLEYFSLLTWAKNIFTLGLYASELYFWLFSIFNLIWMWKAFGFLKIVLNWNLFFWICPKLFPVKFSVYSLWPWATGIYHKHIFKFSDSAWKLLFLYTFFSIYFPVSSNFCWPVQTVPNQLY